MPRQRQNANSARSNREMRKPHIRISEPKGPFDDHWNNKIAIFVAFNIVIVILSGVYLFYQNYLENIVITPINLPPVVTKKGMDKPKMFWGSYRPGSYFGMRTRSPQTVMAGMMWFTQKMRHNMVDIKHWCDQRDSVRHFSWFQHDGENFGIQRIEDKDYYIQTSFVKQVGGKHGGDWTAKINVYTKELSSYTPLSLMFYVWGTPDATLSPTVVSESHLQRLDGTGGSLGNFSVHFRVAESSKPVIKYNYLATEAATTANLEDIVLRNHALFLGDAAPFSKKTGIGGGSSEGHHPNFYVFQVSFVAPFELEVYFESHSFQDRPRQLVGEAFTQELNKHMFNFEDKFESIFKLSEKGYGEENIKVAQAALSNMLGGIGYFYGSSLVQSSYNKEPVNYWNTPLYTSVPSRSFFPRGFLWDEGFHNLLILEWNPEITKDIIGHWLDLMNIEGWIPREQILGPEARQRVPAQFVVQRNTNANPPALFLTLEKMLYKMRNGLIPKDVDFVKRILPRLVAWFNWLDKSQVGMIPGTYRWRGRDSQTDVELNPKTLTSGIDDYPRASHPTIDERHVDLRCWIAFASGVLADLGDFAGEPLEKYKEKHASLTNNKLLDQLHWSTESHSYSDYGFHSTNVELVKERLPQTPGSYEPPQFVMKRVVSTDPTLRFVDNFGYVSLFPFLLKIVDADNPRLGQILTDLKNPNLLWTNFGLRSLAKNSPYYEKHNTEHDPPYWRGAVWINMNFLAVRALKYYGTIYGPYRSQAKELYNKLRNNVINNILKEYINTGYIWEQYDDTTGKGKGVHPFTGWSTLFVLMMGEIY